MNLKQFLSMCEVGILPSFPIFISQCPSSLPVSLLKVTQLPVFPEVNVI